MTQHLWYLRRRGEISGPFPAGQLREMFGAGDLDLGNEVSLDGKHWVRLMETDVLQKPHKEPPPPAALPDEEWQAEREKARRRWREDDSEFESGDSAAVGDEIDRLRHIEQETRELIDANSRKRPAIFGGLAMVLLLAFIGAGVWFGQSGGPKIQADVTKRIRNCNQAAGEGVIWSGCDKNDTRLEKTDLRNADLKGVHLERADLRGADLSYADLQTADLRGADLRGAQLKAVNLSQVDLTGADLRGADLGFAVLSGALVEGARFDGASLHKATWVDGQLCAEGAVGACR